MITKITARNAQQKAQSNQNQAMKYIH